jgi:hypothetical protein
LHLPPGAARSSDETKRRAERVKSRDRGSTPKSNPTRNFGPPRTLLKGAWSSTCKTSSHCPLAAWCAQTRSNLATESSTTVANFSAA